MNAARPEPADAGIILQRGDDHRTTETSGRQQSEHQAGHQAEPDTDRDMEGSTLSASWTCGGSGSPGPPGHHRRNVEEHDRGETPPRRRQHDRFGQQMLHQPSPARADRLADATVPAHASRCEPASCRRYSGTTTSSTAPVRVTRKSVRTTGQSLRSWPSGWYGATMPALNSFVAGYSLAKLRGDGGNRRARLRNADAGRQTAVDVQPLVAPVEARRSGRPKHAGCRSSGRKSSSSCNGRWPLNCSGAMPTTTCGMSSNVERLADDVRIGAQLVLPEPVRQNHDGFSAGYPAVESGSARQRHADRLEVVRGDEHRRTIGVFCPPASGNVSLARPGRPPGHRDTGVGVARGPRSPDRTTRLPASRAPTWRRDDLDERRESVFTPGGGVVKMRAPYGIAMTGAMPMPSDTTHTNVNARAFASDRPAITRSRQISVNRSMHSPITASCAGAEGWHEGRRGVLTN